MLDESIKSDFAYPIPVLASRNIQESVDFFVELGGEKPFVTEDGSFGRVLFGNAELHFYQTDDRHLIEWSCCRVQMKSVDGLYKHLKDKNVLHPNGDLEEKPYGYKEFSILDPSGVCYTFAEFL